MIGGTRTRYGTLANLLSVVSAGAYDGRIGDGFRLLLEAVSEQVGLDRAVLFRRVWGEEALVLAEQRGLPDQVAARLAGLCLPLRGLDELASAIDLDSLQLEDENGSSICLTSTSALGCSTVVLPMVASNGELVGLLVAASSSPQIEISQEELEFLCLLGTQVALALENDYLRDMRRQKAIEASAIREVALASVSTLVVNDLLKAVVEGIVAVINVDRCWILLLDESCEFLLPAYVAGLSPDLERFFYGAQVEVKRSRFFRELLSGWEPIISHDAPNDERLRGRIINLFQIKSLLGLPLKVQDRSIGVIYVDYSKAAHHFTSDEIHLASSFASLAALAIENSRLYAHEQQKRREATVLLDLATAISSTLDLQKVLCLVARASLDATRVDQCVILLSSNQESCLVPKLAVARDDTSAYVEVKCSRLARISETRLQSEVLAGYSAVRLSTSAEKRHPILPWLRAIKAESALVVPIIAKQQLIGVILLSSNQSDRVFSEEEIRVVVGVASQAAVAVENANLFSELAQKELTLRGLVNKIIHAQEEERRRIAADVHDEVIQSVMGMWYRIQACQKWLKVDPDEASQELNVLKSNLEASLQSLRRIILNLRPATLDDYGFVPTLRSFARSFEEETSIGVRLVVRGMKRLTPELESCLYRLVQEATSNIRKHSRASRCRIALIIGPRETLLSVKDNGRGFDLAQVAPSEGVHARFGLISMRERVALVGGSIRIDSRPGSGTLIRIRVPTTFRKEKSSDGGTDQGAAGGRSSNDQGGTSSDAPHGAQHRDCQRG